MGYIGKFIALSIPCGCTVIEQDGQGPETIRFCPLHQAAPDMLTLLESIIFWRDELHDSPKSFLASPLWNEARTVIAKAK